MAGIEITRIINEPSAAVLAYYEIGQDLFPENNNLYYKRNTNLHFKTGYHDIAPLTIENLKIRKKFLFLDN